MPHCNCSACQAKLARLKEKKTMKITRKQADIYFKKLSRIEDTFFDRVQKLENELKREYGEDIEFFWVESEVVGIGNEDRSMKLIDRDN